MSHRRPKILIIEDNSDLQEIYRLAFENAGYHVKMSGNGLIGITDIVDYQPDVVILDIMMPEMDGMAFLTALKNNTSMVMPVFIVSNLSQDQDKQRALQAGADAYFTKADYSGAELVKEISKRIDYLPHDE